IEKLNLAAIPWPADGKYLGDWKNGEKIAQEGRGKQYSDDPQGPVGGNCYACHQLTKEEVSFGTIGPSLYNFGKLRGYTADMQKYAYGKVLMPRRMPRARTCRASVSTESSASSRSRTSSRCSWTPTRRSTSEPL